MSQRDPLTGTGVAQGKDVVVAIIGRTSGRTASVLSEPVLKGVVGSSDSLANANVISVSNVHDSTQGIGHYRQGIDYILEDDKINWDETSMLSVPVQNNLQVSQTAGQLLTGTYYYVVSAVNENGETVLSNEKTAIITSNLGQVIIDWDVIEGAAGYKIWRSIAANDYVTTCLLIQIAGGFISSYVDTGTVIPSAGTPKVVTDAIKNPKAGNTYYVTYESKTYSYGVANRYYTTGSIYKDHGLNSDLSIAGKLVMAKPPEGNGASSCILIAVENQTQSDYITALGALESKNVDIIVSLLPIDTNLLGHCQELSSWEHKKRRVFFTGAKIGTEMGDESTPGSLIYKARVLADRRAIFVTPDSVTIDVPQEDGSIAATVYDSSFLAAAMAGRVASLSDRAEPITKKFIYGIKEIGLNPATGQDYTEIEKDVLASNGLCVVDTNKFGQVLVRHGVTTNTLLVEDSEISIVLAEDEIITAVEETCESFIGQKITDRLLGAIKNAVMSALHIKQKNEVIRTFNRGSIIVEQDTALPTWVLISFTYVPIYPCNVISITYGFDLAG